MNQVFVARIPWTYGNSINGLSDFCGRIRAGGIAGYNYGKYDSENKTFEGGLITECVNYGRIHADMQVGGIAGYSNAYIADCFSACLLGGRNSVGSIVGWQAGEDGTSYPGIVTNCIGVNRVVTKTSTTYDLEGNSISATALTNAASGGVKSNITDHYKLAKYAKNSVYHNNAGNTNPIDYDATRDSGSNVNSCITTTATMSDATFNLVNKKDGVVTNIWDFEASTSVTGVVALASSWQVYLSTHLMWQNKNIVLNFDNGSTQTIKGIAGIDYLNTVLAKTGTSYASKTDSNPSGVCADRGLPTATDSRIVVNPGEKLIWVTKKGDASTRWDGLLREDICLYPMSIKEAM